MFQFPDDLMMATQEVEPENEDVSSPAKIRLARRAERSESKDPAMLIGLIDEPGMFDPIETWKQFLGEIESLPSFVLKQELILRAKRNNRRKDKDDKRRVPRRQGLGPDVDPQQAPMNTRLNQLTL